MLTRFTLFSGLLGGLLFSSAPALAQFRGHVHTPSFAPAPITPAMPLSLEPAGGYVPQVYTPPVQVYTPPVQVYTPPPVYTPPVASYGGYSGGNGYSNGSGSGSGSGGNYYPNSGSGGYNPSSSSNYSGGSSYSQTSSNSNTASTYKPTVMVPPPPPPPASPVIPPVNTDDDEKRKQLESQTWMSRNLGWICDREWWEITLGVGALWVVIMAAASKPV